MTKQLDKAFQEASKLPEGKQDALAEWVLKKLKPKKKEEHSLKDLHETMERIADEVVERYR
jgi:flagellar motor switch protein FliG